MKRFTNADEQREFPKGHMEIVRVANGIVGRISLEPGWRWSEHMKPTAGTELCEAPHFQYHLSGVLHVVNEDGSEFDAKPGDVSILPTRHDAWVVGDEPVVVVDWAGAATYAK